VGAQPSPPQKKFRASPAALLRGPCLQNLGLPPGCPYFLHTRPVTCHILRGYLFHKSCKLTTVKLLLTYASSLCPICAGWPRNSPPHFLGARNATALFAGKWIPSHINCFRRHCEDRSGHIPCISRCGVASSRHGVLDNS